MNPTPATTDVRRQRPRDGRGTSMNIGVTARRTLRVEQGPWELVGRCGHQSGEAVAGRCAEHPAHGDDGEDVGVGPL